MVVPSKSKVLAELSTVAPLLVQSPLIVCVNEPVVKEVPDSSVTFPSKFNIPIKVVEAVPLMVKSPTIFNSVEGVVGIVLFPLPLKIKLLYLRLLASGITTD